METGSVPIQNVATRIFHGEQNAIAVTKNDQKGLEVETSLVSFDLVNRGNAFI
jgi:hypothetical protein